MLQEHCLGYCLLHELEGVASDVTGFLGYCLLQVREGVASDVTGFIV